MAITNYTNLKSSIADFLNRDDLTNVLDTFIGLAESHINRDVRHWKMQHTENIAHSSNGQFILPADWLETVSVQYKDTSNATKKYPLEYVSEATFRERTYNSDQESGTPRYFTVEAVTDSSTNSYLSAIKTFPEASTGTVDVIYYQQLPSLSDTTATNWLLTDAPDIYLYGALIHTAPYLKDDERLAMYGQLYGSAVGRLNQASEQAEYSYDRLKTRKTGLDTSRSRQPNHVRWS